MTFYPQSASGLNYITYPAGPTAAGTTITSGAANTKGSYTELAASSAFACNGVYIEVLASTLSTGRRFLLDIATGAAASESVVIPNIIVEGGLGTSSLQGGVTIYFPLAIASGTRISARCQDSTGSGTIIMAITLIAAGDTPGCAAFTANGANTGTSAGASIDPGGTVDTKGAYTELVASTAAVSQYAVLVIHGAANSAPAGYQWAIDIATGAAASEVVLAPDLRNGTSTSGGKIARSFSFPTYIAASTRIAVRASCNGNDATDRLFQCALYTSVAPAESVGGAFSAAYVG